MNLLINGNAKHIPLADNSVNCVVTSPPYYGLRDYGTAEWVGGDAECEHNPQRPDGGDRSDRSLPLGRGGVYRDICAKCGATRVDNQIGLEQSPDAYVEAMVAVFREVWRVLRDDGTVWLNLGDSYAVNGVRTSNHGSGGSTLRNGNVKPDEAWNANTHKLSIRQDSGLKPKDLIGIPWRVAFALQADGWWLRSEIIWHKPNPMPESVKDRPTKSHEQIFLLTKSARYWYDNEAVKEEANYDGRNDEMFKGSVKAYDGVMPGGQPHTFAQRGHERWQKDENGTRVRNKRSVWTVTTKPYPGSHYAVFPPDLIEPCILAGCPEGGLVLDPFAGSGTTLMVARKHRRDAIGIDLNFTYLTTNARERLQYGSYVPVADGITQLTIGGV